MSTVKEQYRKLDAFVSAATDRYAIGLQKHGLTMELVKGLEELWDIRAQTQRDYLHAKCPNHPANRRVI